jgi:hypothetical protein
MGGTNWNDDVAGNGYDGGVDGQQHAAVRFPGEDLLFQMNVSDLKKKEGMENSGCKSEDTCILTTTCDRHLTKYKY